jgi:exodeoxyribonuclease-3
VDGEDRRVRGHFALKIATWNVNGIRARIAQVQEWISRERPDIVCLQEIKAPSDLLPSLLGELEGYWCYWHGAKGYSGVALHVDRRLSSTRPAFSHPAFDFEHRIVAVELPELTVVSVYVPNGGKDFPAKMQFLTAMNAYAQTLKESGKPAVLCGDFNVARTERDVHPKERKPRAIGQLPEERAMLERIIANDLIDVGRTLDPDNEGLFTWWAPWRDMRARNIGWRLDYVLATASLAARATSCPVQKDVGTSDHAPVVATFL